MSNPRRPKLVPDAAQALVIVARALGLSASAYAECGHD
jgi:hypothetical protein